MPEIDLDRVRECLLPRGALLPLLNWRLMESGASLHLPVLEGVPADAEILEVGYLASYRALTLTLQHESFDRIEPGTMMRRVEGPAVGSAMLRRCEDGAYRVGDGASSALVPAEESADCGGGLLLRVLEWVSANNLRLEVIRGERPRQKIIRLAHRSFSPSRSRVIQYTGGNFDQLVAETVLELGRELGLPTRGVLSGAKSESAGSA